MKYIIAAMISVLAISAHAGSVKETVERIEAGRNVRCDYVKSTFKYCFGMQSELANCRYTETYSCYGAEDFTLKIKVKEFYNTSTGSRETVVKGVQYL